MISIKNEQEIKLMKASGAITYEILMNLKDIIKPGISTKEIDEYCLNFIKSKGCTPSFLNYEGYPACACISINEMVVHGIPDDRTLVSGDIVSVDLGTIYKGYHSDSAYTYLVGDVNEKTKIFVEDTRKALYKGLAVIKNGVKLNEVCKAIESVAKEKNYGVFKCLTGHGVGTSLHEDPYIPNYSNKESKNITLKTGMTLAIEPMFSLGSDQVWLLEDGWGIETRDGSLAAHFEHTIVVTDTGYEILTGE